MASRSQLAADVGKWLRRDDVSTGELFDSILTLAEAQIRRRVRTREQEVTTTLEASRRGTDLPTGFLRQRSLALEGSPARDIDYLPPARLRESPLWNNTGSFSRPTPQAYSVEGNILLLAPAPTEENPVTLLFTYVGAFDPLSDAADTNWLLENAYDIYLYGCLHAAAIQLEDTELEAKYAPLFDTAVRELARSENRARTPSASGLRIVGSPHPIV